MVSCTISSNSCSGGPSVLETGGSAQGGGIDKGTVPFLIKNTIVSGNTATAGSGGYAAGTAFGPDISGTSVTSQGFNLIGITNDSSGWISSDLTGSKLTARDPQLGPLRDNGGPTPTMALLAGSAAIDYGHNSGAATDQRGLPRPINLPDYTDNPNGGDGCDIGAFEVQPSGPVATTLAASQVTSSGASLNGTVNPNGTTATAWFQWGISPSYGNSTPSTNAGAGSSAIPLGAAVTGLVPSTLYHFRAAATNSASTNYGNDLTFITTIIPPVVTTTPATSVTASSATLNGTVNPNGAATTNWFQWGTNTSYGNVIAAASTGSGNSAVPVTATLGSLVPGTTYHFRAVAYNGGGTNFGSDLNFTTLGASLVVTTLSDSGAGSLRAAIAQPGSGNIITFANGLTGTIPLPSGELLLDRAVTITGPGANVVSVSGNHSNRVFNIASGVTASISGLTIANGRKIGATGGNGVNCGDSGQAGGAGLGAGIYNLGNLTLSNCLVSGNAAWGGPGGSAFSILSYCNPSPGGNGGVAQGGGIFNGGSLGLVGCTFRTNQVTGGLGGTGSGSSASAGTGGVGGYGVGGAVYSTGAVQLVNSTFWGNTSTGGEGGSGGSDGTETSPGGGGNGGIGSGAAIELATGGVVAMTNCTLSGNTAVAGATGPGGVDGYFDVDSGDFIVLATGPNGSPGSALGGGLHAASALGGLLNTIIAGNTGGTSPDVNGAITSRGHNLIGATNNSSGWLASDVKGTVATPTNALLGPLQDNGGPTPTLALLTGSRAIDAGDDTATNSLASDQRGLLRFFGAHVDIGAYEVQVPRPTLTVRRAGSKVVLSWPSPSTGFLLLQSPGMNPPNWTTNNTTPSDNGTTRSVTNNSPTGVQFYRLKQ